MSLSEFIEKIQSKPRYIRIQILWLSVFICMVIIVSLWVISLKYSWSITEQEKEIKKPLEEVKEETLSLKEAFKASIGAFFEKSLEEEFEESADQIELGSQKEEIEEIEKESRIIPPAKLPLSK
jgi:sensor histidine kinase YesM